MVPLGEFLGDMTDEVVQYGEKARIIEFVTTGAKAYAFKIDMGNGESKEVCKSKGFELNYETGQSINMTKMIEFVMKRCNGEYTGEEEEDVVTVINRGIRKTKDHQLVTQTVQKTFQLIVDKRKIVPGSYNTCPFGYQI